MTNRGEPAALSFCRIPEVGEVDEPVLTRHADPRRPRPDPVAVVVRRRGEHEHRGVPPPDAHEGEHVEIPVPVAGHVRKPERHVAVLIHAAASAAATA